MSREASYGRASGTHEVLVRVGAASSGFHTFVPSFIMQSIDIQERDEPM